MEKFTGTKNVLINSLIILCLSLISFCIVAFILNVDLTILNRAF